MHPHVIAWWRAQRERAQGHCHAGASSGCSTGAWAGPASEGGSFGVRRPLRFLAHKLTLNDKQAADLARILDQLKIERAQAEVDERRSIASFADAVAGPSYDAELAAAAAKRRAETAERLAAVVERSLREIHALLDGEQRDKLAYLLRSGALTI